ncbi:MAG: ROK family protein [Paracoccus sp. (in: a-proteobacteria)]|uniref:ROK family protein n=1 Tax=Paracoccus sp. TaxID=267 RepID=UPI0026DF733E|nr:ROK family protein [Paracoccus sp. (in: a-proteobacteria)]MDO5612308.1 ROK family protein [Paracoccus sp. (in: a-proteobacteria)]
MIGAGGIDVGGTKIEARLFDGEMAEIARHRVPVPRGDYAGIVDAVVTMSGWLRDRGGADLPVGVGLPGVIDPATGHATTANLPATGRAITAEIAARAGGGRIVFANDCKLFTLSEALGGAAEGAATVFGLVIGTGVGGGVVHRGQLVTGRGGLPGEVGHFGLPAHLDLPVLPCGCGARGCYETLLSGEGIARLAAYLTGQPVPAAQVFARAAAGDAAMAGVADQWFALLTELLLVLNLTIDPDVVVIGGGVSAVPGLADRAQALIDARVLRGTRAPHIRIARFGDASGARGAALFAARQDKEPT